MRAQDSDLRDYVAALPAGEDKTAIAEAVGESLAPLLERLEAQERELRELREHLGRRPWWKFWG